VRKTFKYLAIAVAALLALLLAAAGIIAATFNPNDYKPLLIRLLQEKKQRTLQIPGDIKLSFFPRIGADLGRVGISEHGDAKTEFASVESAKVALALLPLLAKKVVVEQVKVEGLRVRIVRFKDGSTNVDDLLAKDESSSGQPLYFDIDSIHFGNAHVVFDDRQQGRKLELARVDLDTGRIADRVPGKLQVAADIKADKPQVDARLAAKTGFTLDIKEKHYTLKGLDAELKGALAGFSNLALKAAGDADLRPETRRFAADGFSLSIDGKRAGQAMTAKFDIPKLAITDTRVSGSLSGEATLHEGERSISTNFRVPAFEGSPQAFRLPALTLDTAIKEGKLDAKAKITGAVSGDIDKLRFSSPQLALNLSGRQGATALSGSLTTPLSADLKTQQIDLPKLAADFTLPNPGGGTLNLKTAGSAVVHLDKQTASAALAGSLDQSRFDARLGLSDFSPMAYTFDIGIDQLDLDRYKSKESTAPAAPLAPAAPSASASQQAEQPLDLSALQNLRANGSVRIGALKVANIRSANVRFGLHAAGGKLDVNPLAASLYGGAASGALTLTASKPAHIALRQTLSGINVGPLLKDAIGKDPVEGRGNVQLDVTSSGGTFTQIRKSLNGSARLELRDGAVRGVNIAQTVRSAKARIGQLRGDEVPQSGTGSTGEKTDFSEMSGSFRIVNGIAHNEDLVIKSPLIRVAGAGDINLGDERLDYVARTTVVPTLQGQGGPELQALKGVTVPVKLAGPFNAIGWRVDFAGLATELAKQKLGERKEEAKAKAQQSLDEQKAKMREQLKDQLKGLFGK
jgi:AsmA protein